MSNQELVTKKAANRKRRVRARISGSAARPRLAAHISNRHIVAQIIDDENSKTLVYVTTIKSSEGGLTMSTKATWVGSEIAKKARSKKIKQVVFDRGGKLYHGRIKALADAARAGGLEF